MYHGRFKGNHYQIGKKWGSLVKVKGKNLLDHIPYQVTTEMEKFTAESLPFYQKYCPEIIAEIQGIADGQEIKASQLYQVLFPMYAMVNPNHCSSFVVKNEQHFILGRNSDFLTSIEQLYMNCIYQFTEEDYFSFTGNTTAFVEMEDGMNQKGLAVALTAVFPKKIQPGINLGMLVRLILERCQTIDEAIKLIDDIPRCSNGTLVLADQQGQAALVEFTFEEVAIKKNNSVGFFAATNAFHLSEMKNNRVQLDDDWFAEERYQTLSQYLTKHYQKLTIEKAQKLLAGDFGFICQYDRKSGKDTVWSSIYDMNHLNIWRSEGNPQRKAFKRDERISRLFF